MLEFICFISIRILFVIIDLLKHDLEWLSLTIRIQLLSGMFNVLIRTLICEHHLLHQPLQR